MLALDILYLLSVIFLAVYGLNSLLLTWLYRRHKAGASDRRASQPVEPGAHPYVSVQLPVYNERHVVERLLEAATNLDWPAERLQIQVLDDSTDDTGQTIAARLEQYRAQGRTVEIEHIRRGNRHGFKAGALQYGLGSARGEFIAIFDADFIPPSDFIKNTIPYFDDPRVGCIQTRWGHVNPDTSQLTRAQALGIDGHFVVEQSARHAIRAFLNFNGTAGVWRRACMDDAGGWQGDTLTEDLDLSYRAQLGGWRIAYQPEIVVPAELPVQISALKRQQFRWAKGSIQTARKLLGRLWRAPGPAWLKAMGTLHLTNYAVHPLMLANLLLILPMTLFGSPVLALTPFLTLSAAGPPLLYWTAMRDSTLSPPARIGRLAVLVGLGTGLAVSNTRAVLEATLGIKSEFKRTPKFAVSGRSSAWQASTYALPRDPAAWLELLLALYAVTLLVWAISLGVWWLAPWLLMYAGGYAYVAGLAFLQAWETRTARARASGLVEPADVDPHPQGGTCMPQPTPEVDAYLSGLEPERRAALEQLRALVREILPDAAETMRYRMPTYELDGVVCSFASQKHYMSLYLDVGLVEKYKEELEGLDVGKSCIRFKRIQDLPLDTVRRILVETVQNG